MPICWKNGPNANSCIMLKARHNDIHPLLKAAEWLLIMVVCTAVVFALWQVLPIHHASTGALLLLQALQAIGLFIVPSFVVAYLWSERPLEWLRIVDSRKSKVDSRKTGRLVLLSIGIMLTALPLINLLVSWNEQIRLPESLRGLEQLMQQMEAQANALLQQFLTYGNGAWWVLLLNLLVLAVLPAIGEELTFRGVLQQLLYGQPSNPQTLKPSNPQTLKPSNPQTLNPKLTIALFPNPSMYISSGWSSLMCRTRSVSSIACMWSSASAS